MDINAIRLAQIKAQMKMEPKSRRQLGRSNEQIARNLYSMLSDAEARGINKKSLVDSALGTRNEGQAQKQLDELTIPPAITAEKLRGRLGRLQKKPDNYVKIACEWAGKMGRPEDDAILRLFDGTDYGASYEVDEDDYQAANLIAVGLRRIAQTVSENVDLKTFWERLLVTQGRYDPRFERILMAGQDIVIEMGGLKGNAICVDEMSPIASASLVRRLQQPPITGELWIDPEPEDIDFDPSNLPEMPYLSPVGYTPLGGGWTAPIVPLSQDGSTLEAIDPSRLERREARFFHWLDVRLAIGPQADCSSPMSSDIGPLIELRTELEAEVEGARVQLDNPYHDGSAVVRWAKLGRRWHRAVIGAWNGEAPDRISNAYFDMPEHTYFAWGELSGPSLEYVLSDDILPNAPAKADWHRDFVGIAVGSLLRSIEHRMHGSLADELLNRAIGLRQLVRDHRAASKRAFDERLSQTLRGVAKKAAAFPANDEEA